MIAKPGNVGTGDWQALFDRTVSAWAEGDMAAGRMACDLVLNHPDTRQTSRDIARRNAVHYAPELRHLIPSYREHQESLSLSETSLTSRGQVGKGLPRATQITEYGPEWRLLDQVRESTPLLVDGDDWLAIIRESVEWEHGETTCLHRIIRLGQDHRLTAISHPFRLHKQEPERVIEVLRDADEVVIWFETGDQSVWKAEMPMAELLALLWTVDVSDKEGSRRPDVSGDLESGPLAEVLVVRERAAKYLQSLSGGPDQWVSNTAACLTHALMMEQIRLGVDGDVLEIGVDAGGYSLVLATSLQRGERAIAVDLWDLQEQNIDRSGYGRRGEFEARIERFASDVEVVILRANSLDLGDAFVAEYPGLRFVSVDGGHTRHTTQHDLWLAQRMLRPGGIVALDDIYRPDWSGVTAGLARYFHDGGRCVPFAIAGGKALLTTDHVWASHYGQVLAETFPTLMHRDRPWQEFFAADQVAIFATAGNPGMEVFATDSDLWSWWERPLPERILGSITGDPEPLALADNDAGSDAFRPDNMGFAEEQQQGNAQPTPSEHHSLLRTPVNETIAQVSLSGTGNVPNGETVHSAPASPVNSSQLPATWTELLSAPVFIVNLDRRPDRLAMTVDQVRRAGFQDIHRVRAIDGQDSELLDQAWATIGRPMMHPGEPLFVSQSGRQGCFLSITLLLRYIVEHEIPLAVIFEDDALFHSDWDALGPAFYAETPKNLDLLYLGGSAERWDAGDGVEGLSTATTLPPLRPESDWRSADRVVRTPTYKTGAFAITLHGARSILNKVLSMEGGVYAIDNMLNHLQRHALAGTPGAELSWATWNATALPDPDLAWLPQQRQGETGLVFQRLELGTDVDPRWLTYVESVTSEARARASETGSNAPPSIEEQIEAALAAGVLDELPVIDLLAETRGWLLRGASEEREALDAALASIDPDRPDQMWECFPASVPSISEAQRRLVNGAGPEREVVFGVMPDEPLVSAIIPVYEHFGEIGRQLRAFAEDSEARWLEVIYVLDSPWREREFLEAAERLHRIFAVPFRVLVMNRNAGYSTACNTGVAASRAGTLLLLNSDAWPSRPGWMGIGTRFIADHPDAGLVGPKLIYPDGRIHGDGCLWKRHYSPPCWGWATANWGVASDSEAVVDARPMPAMGTAAVMVSRAVFEAAGGFSAEYVIGQFEDCDLSCRVSSCGREHWFLPDLEFMHEESRSYHGAERRRHWLVNAWLFTERWGAWLDDRQ
jgi:GT2 family glycosyltransferase/SAM-dependent methyltransferase